MFLDGKAESHPFKEDLCEVLSEEGGPLIKLLLSESRLGRWEPLR